MRHYRSICDVIWQTLEPIPMNAEAPMWEIWDQYLVLLITFKDSQGKLAIIGTMCHYIMVCFYCRNCKEFLTAKKERSYLCSVAMDSLERCRQEWFVETVLDCVERACGACPSGDLGLANWYRIKAENECGMKCFSCSNIAFSNWI